MTEHKNHGLLTLPDIFDGGKHRFRIPDYQRGYSWEERQCKDLLDDIEEIVANTKNNGGAYRHYTGTIVATPSEKGYEIVDGQQRLSTFIMLLSNIHKSVPALQNDLDTLFLISGRGSGNPEYKFLPGEEQKELFINLLTEHTPGTAVIKNKSDRYLVDAYEQLRKWVEDENKTENNLREIYNALMERFGFLFYTPENTNEVSIMFEVINNRGKPLSELEKIKNYIVYFASKTGSQKLRDDVQDSWPRILSRLQKCDLTSNSDEDSFLRHCWIVFQENYKQRDLRTYDELKEIKTWERFDEFVRFMDRAAYTYLKLFTREEVDGKEKLLLEQLACQNSISSVMPLIIAIYEQLGTDEFTESRLNLITLIEKLNFRYYGTAIARRSDSGQGELFRYAHTFYHHYGKPDPDDENGVIVDENWLQGKLIAFVAHRANDTDFIKNLTLDKGESGDYYYWPELKYFLANYELSLMDGKNQSRPLSDFFFSQKDVNAGSKQKNDVYHREHILAQKDATKIKENNKEHEALIDLQRRRLGNFMLLNAGSNKSEGNNPPEDKIEEYAEWMQDKSCVANTYMVKELKEGWNKAETAMTEWKRRTEGYWHELYQRFFDQREEKMLNFALDRWRIKEVDNLAENVKKVEINSIGRDEKIYMLIKEQHEGEGDTPSLKEASG